MREDDIDTMLAIIEQERLEKKDVERQVHVSIRLLRFMLVSPKNLRYCIWKGDEKRDIFLVQIKMVSVIIKL